MVFHGSVQCGTNLCHFAPPAVVRTTSAVIDSVALFAGPRAAVAAVQSRLKPDDKRKVEGARGTTRVNGESYRQGEIYISSLHTELDEMEV